MATITKATLNPTITGANLNTFLQGRCNAAFGVSAPWHTYTSGNNSRSIYRVIFNSTTYGTLFWELRVETSGANERQISSAWYTDFNTTTNTGTNVINSISSPQPTASTSINSWSFQCGTEGAVVVVRQGTGTYWYFGYLRPANKVAWWDENVYPYFFVLRMATFTNLGQSVASLSPFTGSINYNLGGYTIRAQLPNNLWEIRQPVFIENTGSTQSGFCGSFSSTFGMADTNGITPDDDFDFNSATRIFRPMGIGMPGGLVVEEI